MKNSLRICAIASILLAFASIARGQDGATRAEFDCLTLANSSAAPSTETRLRLSHFITCGRRASTTGPFQSNGLKLAYETQGSGR